MENTDPSDDRLEGNFLLCRTTLQKGSNHSLFPTEKCPYWYLLKASHKHVQVLGKNLRIFYRRLLMF